MTALNTHVKKGDSHVNPAQRIRQSCIKGNIMIMDIPSKDKKIQNIRELYERHNQDNKGVTPRDAGQYV